MIRFNNVSHLHGWEALAVTVSTSLHRGFCRCAAELQPQTSSESAEVKARPAAGGHISVLLCRLVSCNRGRNRAARSGWRTSAAF